MSKVEIKVPATSANLGPGFDTFGCALSMYNKFTFDTNCDGLKITGCPDKFQNEHNQAYQSYCATLDKLGITNKKVAINIDATIPIARGLGSSSTLIVAGAMAANELYNGGLSKQEILGITNIIEGHPDNLTPAIFGGLTASFVENNKPYVVNFPINENWTFVLLIPEFKLETSVAREALPKTVAHKDAVFNISHASLLLKALEDCDEELLYMCMQDKLHQEYRKHLIEDYEAIESLSKDHQIPFCISGGGPTLLCVTNKTEKVSLLKNEISKIANKNWAIYELNSDFDGAKVNSID